MKIMMRSRLLTVMLPPLLLLTENGMVAQALACTTAVISGSATPDGRPILWKNRDYGSRLHNEMAEITGGKFKAIAVVNAGSRSSVWMGVNEAGFCIENSLSKDLKIEGKTSGPGNGTLMRMALQTCATVADFENLLKETNNSGRATIANFGVIDAQGGAALFETGPKQYKMFDANDPKVAPRGYIVRSNFSTTAQELDANPSPAELSDVSSSDRYLRACGILELTASDGISVEEVLRQCARDLSDEQGNPLPGSVNGKPGTLPTRIATKNTISRTTTVSAAVFHGVRPGEDPRLTTMWTMLGDPKFTIAVPSFVVAGVADDLTDERGGEIGEIAITLREWSLTPDKEAIYSDLLPGIWSDLWALEDRLLTTTLRAKQRWSQGKAPVQEIKKLHNEAAQAAMKAMSKELQEAKTIALAKPAPKPPVFNDSSFATSSN
ncbi:carcinine hydrolase/isopenicillin-N N-acyltransferase family protein [Rosistilla oblonga]|uniref:Peptidase C45 hydrolase domain-containing protein n=1 Tax=Rosistilla oblonga TaxID=2527990 RepID=A0A518IPT0_9BACT|nr:carcinine hydrolase/isopenicillin-N N-acyltransferase family protein [Rosistilla oblonga]QDV55099.1 hypothetical protein Mal33_10680 [Rosistilla oblonga]